MQLWGRLLSAFLIAFTGSTLSAASATGYGKVALVIGNGAYANAPDLPNPPNDARAMASLLRTLDFEVVEGTNLDKTQMIELIDQFIEKAYGADIGLVFYAGHGMQVGGKNFLIPVDAELTSPAHLKTRTIEIEELVAALPPDPGVGIVFLDACRDNPLARTLARSLPATRSSSVGTGLAAVQVKTKGDGTGGTLIGYATDPGAVALDGENTANSPYTQALVRHLSTPGIELQAALTRVRGDVAKATDGRQRPWHNASLGREIFLGGKLGVAGDEGTGSGTQSAALAAPTSGPAATGQSAAGGDRNWEVERRFWDEAAKRNTIAHYEAYLATYPDGEFAAIAALNIEQLKSREARLEAGQKMTPAAEPAAAHSATAQTRAAIEVTEEVRTTPGTAVTEEAIGMSRDERRDLQLRLNALGHDAGGADGMLGPRSRQAIGAWQRANGILETQMLTSGQWAVLQAQSEPLMAEIRRQEAAAAARRRAQANVRSTSGSAETSRSTGESGTANRQAGRNEKKRGGKAGAFVGGAILGGAAAIVTCKAIGAC